MGRWGFLLTALFISAAFGEDEERLRVCGGCQGADGNSARVGVPSPASRSRAYRDKPRSGGDTIMTAAVYGLADSDINALAHYLARLR